MNWPTGPYHWIENQILYVSIPFTWNLPTMKTRLQQSSLFYKQVIVGGPAVYLMPGFFDELSHVSVSYDMPGILQRINPLATRTTTGCIRNCGFCGVRRFEGKFRELAGWPDLPIICDNNLLAASDVHFDRVIERLVKWGWADFNQGLDVRLLTEEHAYQLARIKKPMLRLALDHKSFAEDWAIAFGRLRRAGVAKANIRSYALLGYDSDPDEAWRRCEWIEKHSIKVLPMWYHPLDALVKNQVTPRQRELGWDDYERRRIMQWFYQHKKAVQTMEVL